MPNRKRGFELRFPGSLIVALSPITVIVGHYGAGKTNFSMNVAIDLASDGANVTVIDLDVVNPYFRATEQRNLLESHGIGLVAPVFSEAGTSLDVPSLTGRIIPTIQDASDGSFVIIDAGGDDAGATALGRFSRDITARDYAMLYVANRFRNLVQDPIDAVENLREIECASHLKATALVNNSHLKDATIPETIEAGVDYANEVARLTGLPLACTTVPSGIGALTHEDLYQIQAYVKNPWE